MIVIHWGNMHYLKSLHLSDQSNLPPYMDTLSLQIIIDVQIITELQIIL